jgi:hypothetical protein
MEKVASLKKGRNNDPSGMEIYNPNMGDNEVSQINTTEPQGGMALALGMYGIHEYWNKGGNNSSTREDHVDRRTGKRHESRIRNARPVLHDDNQCAYPSARPADLPW